MSEQKEIVVVNQAQLLSEKELDSYPETFGIGKTLSQNERRQFIDIARTWGLNPFKREVHVSAYGQGDKRQCSIIIGYEVYIKRAERTGKLDGWNCAIEGSGKDMKAVITIYRKDFSKPFVHEVYFEEAAQKKFDGTLNYTRSKQPRFMLKKVAIGQGFRLCFSDELGGMPYAEGELPIAETRDVTPEKELIRQAIEQEKAQPVIAPQNDETAVEILKRDIWDLIKKFPKEKQTELIEAAKDKLQAGMGEDFYIRVVRKPQCFCRAFQRNATFLSNFL